MSEDLAECRVPSITTQPQSQAVITWEPATLSVVADGNAPFTYQWYSGFNGDTSSPIPGAKLKRYTTPGLSPGTHNYWVRATNMCGIADSNTAAITAGVAVPVITSIRSQKSTPGSFANIFGSNFSTKRRNNTIFIGGVAVTKDLWAVSSRRLRFIIPDMPPGMTYVYVTVKGVSSNTKKFEVK